MPLRGIAKPVILFFLIFLDLSLQKWVFDPGKEVDLLLDPAAVQLLCCQAQWEIKTGKLKPTGEVEKKMEGEK